MNNKYTLNDKLSVIESEDMSMNEIQPRTTDYSEPYITPINDEVAPHSVIKRHMNRLDTLNQKYHRILFKDAASREVDEGKREMVSEEIEYRIREIRAMHETQFQSIVEKANTWLTAGKTLNRKNLSVWFSNQIVDFENKLIDVEARFEDLINRYAILIERTRNPMLKKFKLRELERRMVDFHEMLGQITQEFKSILSEGIDKYTGKSRISHDDTK